MGGRRINEVSILFLWKVTPRGRIDDCVGTPPIEGFQVNIFWFLPTHGDGRYLATTTGGRQLSFSYLLQTAQAADSLGFDGVLIPTGRSCEDPWVIGSAVAPATSRLRLLIAVRPGIMEPVVAARMAATLDRVGGIAIDLESFRAEMKGSSIPRTWLR